MSKFIVSGVVVLTLMALLIGCRVPTPYEVWTIDQADAAKGGAKINIFKGDALEKGQPGTPEVIDLDTGVRGVGAGPGVRPHALSFNNKGTHAIIANVASGHIYFLRLKDRKIVQSIDVGDQAHWAASSPDDSMVIVANQNGKKLARIKADFSQDKFTHNPGDDLDLGALQDAAHPDNAPICPLLFDPTGKNVYITLRGGGLYVVDTSSTPMKLVKSYGKDEIAPAGCGGILVGKKVYVNSGTATSGHVYVFDSTDHKLLKTLNLTSYGTDAHGLVLTGGGKYLWVGNRGDGDNFVVIDTNKDEVLGVVPSVGQAPDIMDISPNGKFIFLTLRPASPLTGGAPARGEKPGIAVIEVTDGGSKGIKKLFVPLGDQSPQSPNDFHALAVRVLR